GIRHGFFTRQGGVSHGPYASLNTGPGSADAAGNVAENRRRVQAVLGARHLVTAYQVHGSDAICVRAPFSAPRPRADALATDRPGLAVGVLTADCAPILLADAQAGVVAAAHGGWRGVLAGIVASTVDAMTTLGAMRHRIHATIGPAIAQQSYEVGNDLRAAFLAARQSDACFFAPGERPGHWMFALADLAAQRLREAGVGHVDVIRRDTYGEPALFYSFRRATHHGERDYGRQISAIVLASKR
ncbi:MAG: peptidoglycan editing factor PgeF, partial [Alphaproteobacteria bacterium]